MPSISTEVNLIESKTGGGSKNRITVIAAIIIAIILLALLALIFMPPLVFGKPYFVVYTANGEIYVGKASWFPRFYLTDVYLLQTSTPLEGAPPGSNLQLVPLRDAPWSPKKLYFQEDQIVFYGPVDEASSVAQSLKNR